jgi:hypothetical protein
MTKRPKQNLFSSFSLSILAPTINPSRPFCFEAVLSLKIKAKRPKQNGANKEKRRSKEGRYNNN